MATTKKKNEVRNQRQDVLKYLKTHKRAAKARMEVVKILILFFILYRFLGQKHLSYYTSKMLTKCIQFED